MTRSVRYAPVLVACLIALSTSACSDPPDETVAVVHGGGGSLSITLFDSSGALSVPKADGSPYITYESIVKIEGLLTELGCATEAIVAGTSVPVVNSAFEVYDLVKGAKEISIEVYCGASKEIEMLLQVQGPEDWAPKSIAVEAPDRVRVDGAFVPMCVGVFADGFVLPIEDEAVTLEVLSDVAWDPVDPFVIRPVGYEPIEVECRLGDLSARHSVEIMPGLPHSTQATTESGGTYARMTAGTSFRVECEAWDAADKPTDALELRPEVLNTDGWHRDGEWVTIDRAGRWDVVCDAWGVANAQRASFEVVVEPDAASAGAQWRSSSMGRRVEVGEAFEVQVSWQDWYGNELEVDDDMVIEIMNGGAWRPALPDEIEVTPLPQVPGAMRIVVWTPGEVSVVVGGDRSPVYPVVPLRLEPACEIHGSHAVLSSPEPVRNSLELRAPADARIASVRLRRGASEVLLAEASEAPVDDEAAWWIDEGTVRWNLDDAAGWSVALVDIDVPQDDGTWRRSTATCSVETVDERALSSTVPVEMRTRPGVDIDTMDGPQGSSADSASEILSGVWGRDAERQAGLVGSFAGPSTGISVRGLTGVMYRPLSMCGRRSSDMHVEPSSGCALEMYSLPDRRDMGDVMQLVRAVVFAPPTTPDELVADIEGASGAVCSSVDGPVYALRIEEIRRAFNQRGPARARRYIADDVAFGAWDGEALTFDGLYADHPSPTCREARVELERVTPSAPDIRFERASYSRDVRQALAVITRDRTAVRVELHNDVAPWVANEMTSLVREVDRARLTPAMPLLLRPASTLVDSTAGASDVVEIPVEEIALGGGVAVGSQLVGDATWAFGQVLGYGRAFDIRRTRQDEPSGIDLRALGDMPGWSFDETGTAGPTAFRSRSEDGAIAVPFVTLNWVLRAYASASGTAGFALSRAGVEDPDGFAGLPPTPPAMSATLRSAGVPTIEPHGAHVLVTLPAVAIEVQSGAGDAAMIDVTMQYVYELAAARDELDAVRASLGTRVATPDADLVVIGVPDSEALEQVMAGLGLPVRLDAVGGVVTLDTTPLEDLLVPRVQRVMERMMNELLYNLTIPGFDLPPSLASDVQPAGTPFRYVALDEASGVAPVRVAGGAIVVAGAFDRIGQECTSDADCACDPSGDEAWCTSASMECVQNPGGAWCVDP